MAFMALADKLIKRLENGEFIIGVFLEFPKAFDKVHQLILLSKRSHHGIRGNALQIYNGFNVSYPIENNM